MTEEIIRRRAAATGHGRPGDPARTLPRRSRSPRARSSACRSSAARTRSWTSRPISGAGGRRLDLSQHDIEDLRGDRRRARLAPSRRSSIAHGAMRTAGADVIDLGGLPDTPFPHLEEAIRLLKAEGFAVSIDSGNLATRSRTRRWRGRRLSPQPRRGAISISPSKSRRSRSSSRRDTATSTRLSAPARSSNRRACHISPIRCSSRSISASWNRLARYAGRSAPEARRRDADGHRQPDGTDGSR